jgi:hypothetical protein
MENNINEVVVEGLTPEDFSLLLDLVENAPITIRDSKYEEVLRVRNKIKEIVTFLRID